MCFPHVEERKCCDRVDDCYLGLPGNLSDDVETVWLDLSEWQTVRERIDRLEAVRQRRADGSSSEGEAA